MSTALATLGQQYEIAPEVHHPRFPWYPPEIFSDMRTFNKHRQRYEDDLWQAERSYKREAIESGIMIPRDLLANADEILSLCNYLLDHFRWPVFREEEVAAAEEINQGMHYNEKIHFRPINIRPFLETVPPENRAAIAGKITTCEWGNETIDLILTEAPTIHRNYPGGIIPFLNDLDRVGKLGWLDPELATEPAHTTCVHQWTKTVIANPPRFAAIAGSPEDFEEFVSTGAWVCSAHFNAAAPYFKMDMYNPVIAQDFRENGGQIVFEDIDCEATDILKEAGAPNFRGELHRIIALAFMKFWGDPNFEAYKNGLKTLLGKCVNLDTNKNRYLRFLPWERAIKDYLLLLPESFAPSDPTKPVERTLLPTNINFHNQAMAIAHATFQDHPMRLFHSHNLVYHQTEKGRSLDQALADYDYTPVYDEHGQITEIQRPETHRLIEELRDILNDVVYAKYHYEDHPTAQNLQACAEADTQFYATLEKLEALELTPPLFQIVENIKEEFKKESAVEGRKLIAAQKAPAHLWRSIILPEGEPLPGPSVPNDPNPLQLPVLHAPRYQVSDWLQKANPATKIAVIGEAFRRALIQVATATRGPRLLVDRSVPLEEIQHDHGAQIRRAIPEHLPAVEAWVRQEQIKDPGKMVIGTKVHTEAAMFEERVNFLLDLFEGFGLYSTPFSLDSQGKTLVAPPLPNTLVHKLLFGMYDLFGLINQADPQFQICLAGRWKPETAAIFGSSILLSNFQAPEYREGSFTTNMNGLTDSRIMAYDAGPQYRLYGMPYDLEAAIGRSDLLGQNDHTVLNRGRTLGTVCSHHDYEGPFKILFEEYRDAFLIALNRAGKLDEVIMESGWIAQHAAEGDTSAQHEAMIQKIQTSWRTNQILRETVRNLIAQLDAIFLASRDQIIRSNPAEFARLDAF